MEKKYCKSQGICQSGKVGIMESPFKFEIGLVWMDLNISLALRANAKVLFLQKNVKLKSLRTMYNVIIAFAFAFSHSVSSP